MALRQIEKQVNGNREARVMYDTDVQEYIVKFYTNGKHYAPADYFTDDKADAQGTARLELANMQ